MESKPGQSTPSPSMFPPTPNADWGQWSPTLLQKTLQQGIAALEQKQYDQAIALLEPILKYVRQPQSKARLHKTLAKAYMAQGNAAEALPYCQALEQSPDPAAQKWARNAIAHLHKQQPNLAETAHFDPATTLNDEANIAIPPRSAPKSPRRSTAAVPSPTPPSSPAPRQAPPLAQTPPSPTKTQASSSPPVPVPSPSPSPTATGFRPLSPAPNSRQPTASPLSDRVYSLEEDAAHPQQTTSAAKSQGPRPNLSVPKPPNQREQKVTTGSSVIDTPDSSSENFVGQTSKDAIEVDPAAVKTRLQPTTTRIQDHSDVAHSSPPSLPQTLTALTIDSLPWQQAARAKHWSAIPAKLTLANRINTLLTYAWTAIALWGIAVVFLRVSMALGNPLRDIVSKVMRIERWYFLEYYPGRVAAIILGVLLLLAPIILHLWVRWGHKAKPLSPDGLGRYSPEAKALLTKVCKKAKHPVPRLQLIESQTPLLFSYGWRPQLAWIVVSDGLLRQLSDDELATLYAAELGHIRQWSLWLLTGFTLFSQISYGFYQGLSQWGDGWKNGFFQWLGAAGSAIAYGLFWLVRNAGLWLARSRHSHSDRVAANLTGNPNGLIRALLKVAIATATDIRRHGKTVMILEQFEWLMPVGYRAAISIGSVFPVQWQRQHMADGQAFSVESTILAWDYRNPDRDWMAINNTHPPLGDRLRTLARYAQHWRLEPELALPSQPRLAGLAPKMQQQMAPFFGILIGAGISLLLWLVGLISNQLGWPFDWLRYEATSIFWGMLAMGFSFGTILRMNPFFPSIQPLPQTTSSQLSSSLTTEELADLLIAGDALPIDSHPVQLEGKLLGRKGISNWFNQDLTLQTQAGLIRLHCISTLGTMGHLIFDAIRLTPLKGRTVTVTGWLRRGCTPWVDVHTIKPQQGKLIQAGHPIWSLILAIALALWGAYVLYKTDL